MSNVLFLVHRIPFPPDKGDKIRSYHLLKHFSRDHNVYLGAFVDDKKDYEFLPDLERLCGEVFLRASGKWRSYVGAALSFIRCQSLSVGYYEDKSMREWVRETLNIRSIDAVVTFSSTMAQYLPARSTSAPALIADFVDVDSDKWRQYSEESKWPLSWVYNYEAHALEKWESIVARASDVVSVVSAAEREVVPVGAKPRARIEVVGNGVNTEYFDPSRDYPDPYAGCRQVVVFTGAMDYYANVDGVCWFADNIWPGIRATRSKAEFFVVGSNPTRAVRKLEQIPGISVTGRVPDVRPYIRHASVAVAPLRLARGVQNKVLEALAMNRPVVATPQVLQGLSGDTPDLVTEAVTESDFRHSVGKLLDTEVGAAIDSGREYVRAQYDWDRNLSIIASFIPRDVGVRVSRA